MRGAHNPAPNWREIVTPASRIRHREPGIVDREGGGTEHPTLGGGIGFSREQKMVRVAGAR